MWPAWNEVITEPRNITTKRIQFTYPYTKYCVLSLGWAQSTFRIHQAEIRSYQSSLEGSITAMVIKRNGILVPDEQCNRVLREISIQETLVYRTSILRRQYSPDPCWNGNSSRHTPPTGFPSCHTDLLDKLRNRVLDNQWDSAVGNILSNLRPLAMLVGDFPQSLILIWNRKAVHKR